MPTGPTEDSSEKSKKPYKLPPEDRLAIIRRVEAGEKQSALAREFGVTRQYVSLVMIKYRQEGEEAVVGAKRGRAPSRPLTPDEEEVIHRTIVEKPTPKKAGLSVHSRARNVWEMDSVKRLIARELHFTPSQRVVLDLLEKWGIAIGKPEKVAGIKFSNAYYQYINSPIGREVSRRNLEMRDRDLARRAEEEIAKTQPAGAAEESQEGEDEDEIEFSEEDLERIRREMLAGKIKTGGAGQRSGRHRKARAQQKRKPRKKKRRKK